MNKKHIYSVIIKIEKTDFLKVKNLFTYQVKVKRQDQDFFYLQVSESDLENIISHNLNYEMISAAGLKKIKEIFFSHISIFIGIIFFVFIIFINTLTIKEITFSTYTKDNEKIHRIITESFISFGGLNFFKGDINDLNYALRKEFSNFEWISLDKKGSKIHVTVLEPSIINKQVKTISGYGDLIASKTGLIKKFQVKHGIVLIDQNQYVKEGQILVSGNLRYHYEDESNFYVPAEGKVYAEVWYTDTVTVQKESMNVEYTGKISEEKSLSLFGLNLKYRSSSHEYEEYDIITEDDYLNIFSIKLPIGIKKRQFYEKNAIINVYDEKTAYAYALSKIRYQMTQGFTEGDKILDIELIKQTENEKTFSFTFFIKTYENIAEFQRRLLDEQDH